MSLTFLGSAIRKLKSSIMFYFLNSDIFVNFFDKHEQRGYKHEQILTHHRFISSSSFEVAPRIERLSQKIY